MLLQYGRGFSPPASFVASSSSFSSPSSARGIDVPVSFLPPSSLLWSIQCFFRLRLRAFFFFFFCCIVLLLLREGFYLIVVQLGGDISSNGARLLPQLVTLGRNCLRDDLDFSVLEKEAWQMLGVALHRKYTRMHQVCVAVVAAVASLELN
jgi:hypothetical protein